MLEVKKLFRSKSSSLYVLKQRMETLINIVNATYDSNSAIDTNNTEGAIIYLFSQQVVKSGIF